MKKFDQLSERMLRLAETKHTVFSKGTPLDYIVEIAANLEGAPDSFESTPEKIAKRAVLTFDALLVELEKQ